MLLIISCNFYLLLAVQFVTLFLRAAYYQLQFLFTFSRTPFYNRNKNKLRRTTMTLENKLGISNSLQLANEEEKITKRKALLLFETGFLNVLEAGSFSALAAIHKFLFEDIYDFAGQIRTVNIAKGSFRFVPALYLSDALESISKMPQQICGNECCPSLPRRQWAQHSDMAGPYFKNRATSCD